MRRRSGEIDFATQLLLLGSGIERNAALLRGIKVDGIGLERHRLENERRRIHRSGVKQNGFHFHIDRFAKAATPSHDQSPTLGMLRLRQTMRLTCNSSCMYCAAPILLIRGPALVGEMFFA